MTRDLTRAVHVTLTPETSLGEALRVFDQTKVEALAVLNRGKYVGVVSRNDVVRYAPSPASTLSKWEMSGLLENISIHSQKLITELPRVDYKWEVRHKLDALLESDSEAVAVMNDGQFSHIESWKDLCGKLMREPQRAATYEVELMQPKDFALSA